MTLDGGLLNVKQQTASKTKAEKKAYTDSEESDESDEQLVTPQVDEAAEKEALERSMRHMNDTQWTSFCNSHLKRFEKKWTTKLEDYKDGKLIDDSDSEGSGDEHPENGWKDDNRFNKGSRRPGSGKDRYIEEDNKDEDEEDDEDQESFMSKMLEQGLQKRQEITKREGIHKPSRENQYKVEDKKEEDTSFYANQYWHKPDVLNENDLDALLKSEGFDL